MNKYQTKNPFDRLKCREEETANAIARKFIENPLKNG